MMGDVRLPTVKQLVVWGLASVLLIALAGFAFAWSGVYNVAASSGHFPVTRWLLEFGMRQSVATQSLTISAPSLDDENLAILGAGHFQGGCAPCHGAPGVQANPIVKHMLPAPPSLAAHVPTWKDRHLFWIVKHGLKYTGMPAWTSQQRDDEVWAVVAFLRQMPNMTPERYQWLAFGSTRLRQRSAADLVAIGPSSAALAACARCHGDEKNEPRSALVPRLAGQTKSYLVSALKSYAEGTRQSGIMAAVAAELTPQQMDAIAEFYSGLDRPASQRSEQARADQEGRRIVEQGTPSQAIPSCTSCHGSSAADTFPRLAGLSSAYIVSQLELFRKGARSGTPQAAIMAPIAKRLTDQQIEDVAAYYESLAPPNNTSAKNRPAARPMDEVSK